MTLKDQFQCQQWNNYAKFIYCCLPVFLSGSCAEGGMLSIVTLVTVNRLLFAAVLVLDRVLPWEFFRYKSSLSSETITLVILKKIICQ